MMDFLATLDWGTVPAWFGGISFLLALRIFAKDRRASDREQINQLGVWPDTTSAPHSEECGRYFLIVKNASNLPLRVTEIRTATYPRWVKDVPEESIPTAAVQRVQPGETPRIDTTHFGIIPPEEEKRSEQLPHFGEIRPKEEGWRLGEWSHLRAEVRHILAVDNANRRWIIRPNKGGAARRVRWYSLLRERIRNPFHPWSRPIDSFISYWVWMKLRGFKPSNLRRRPWRMGEGMRFPD